MLYSATDEYAKSTMWRAGMPLAVIILGSMRNEMEHGTACVTVGTELATSWVFATLADAHADALPRRALRLRGQASDRESNTTKKLA